MRRLVVEFCVGFCVLSVLVLAWQSTRERKRQVAVTKDPPAAALRKALGEIVSLSPSYADPLPPAPNVHGVSRVSNRDNPELTAYFWRGGAPTVSTLAWFIDRRIQTDIVPTFIDLRRPPTTDDRSGKGGRLSPSEEKLLVERFGFRYVSISAMDKNLISVITKALAEGDVYMHCMYGVNRVAYALGRWAEAGHSVGWRKGFRKDQRDWNQGVKFQKTLQVPRAGS